jgi:hypothetical protein
VSTTYTVEQVFGKRLVCKLIFAREVLVVIRLDPAKRVRAAAR